MGEARVQKHGNGANPRVSIIIRSMGRPELRKALASVAAQTYPFIDIVVVDATGGRHPPLPSMAWPEGMRVRMVSSERPLPRPQAANAGLDAVESEYFGFIDDDDACLPHHVATLVEALSARPDLLAAYGQTCLMNQHNRVTAIFGVPFHPARMFAGTLFHWQAALVRRRALTLGCRFDESLDVCEDKDFMRQVASHSGFVFVPRPVVEYWPELGTSGVGGGTNRDEIKCHHYDALLAGKWSHMVEYHAGRLKTIQDQAMHAWKAGDPATARIHFVEALNDYPEDPNLLHGLAQLFMDSGASGRAEKCARRAMDAHPHAMFAATLEQIRERRAQAGVGRPPSPDVAMENPVAGVSPQAEAPAPVTWEACPAGRPILVSIIVRSTGRPSLQEALASIAAQDHPWLEVVLVDATGGQHGPVVEAPSRPGLDYRVVSRGRPLNRPEAANAGFEAVRGDWFCVLDDDDVYEPNHVSTLLTASGDSSSLLYYSQSRLIGPDGEVESLFGTPFNRMLMYYGPLFCWQAALFSRQLLELGCRCDEAMITTQDLDFVHQAAEYTDPVYIPTVTFNYRRYLGSSGTGRGTNQDTVKRLRYEARLRAKWAGRSTYHSERVGQSCHRAIHAFEEGDPALAEQIFLDVLREYPDEPNALNGLARVCLVRGELEQAESWIQRAIALRPGAMEYQSTLQDIRRRLGSGAGPGPQASRSPAPPAGRSQGNPPHPSEPPSRLAPCSCGSGKRYKHCCALDKEGAVPQAPLRSTATPEFLTQALHCLQRNDPASARRWLSQLEPESLTEIAPVHQATRLALALEDHETSYRFLRQAWALDAGPETHRLLTRCFDGLFAGLRETSLLQQIRDLLETSETIQQAPAKMLHIVALSGILGRAGAQAEALYADARSKGLPAFVWTPCNGEAIPPPGPGTRILDETVGRIPDGGDIVFLAIDREIGHWFRHIPVRRAMLLIDRHDRGTVLKRLVQLRDNPTLEAPGLLFPSPSARQAFWNGVN